MLTRAEILSIDYTTNTCSVRIPTFESAGDNTTWQGTAVIAIPPGVYNGYKAGDMVIVGFEDHNEGLPVVVGKLYVSPEIEKNSTPAINCSDISIKNSLDIPVSTTFNFNKADGVQSTSSAATTVATLLDLINRALATENNLKELTDSLNLNKLLATLLDVPAGGGKTFYATKDGTTGKITYEWV